MRRILVSGAAGFVGTHLLEALAAYPVSTVALYHRNRPESSTNTANTDWRRCDLSKDDLMEHLDGVDTIFHLAAAFSANSGRETAIRLHVANVDATERLASAATRIGARFIHVSSIAAGEADNGQTVVDASTGRPKSAYGVSKRIGEEKVMALGAKGLRYVILRPTALFGEHHDGSILELARTIRAGRFFLFGKGGNATNFYYVKDFVSALLAVANSDACLGKTYIAADRPLPLADLTAEIGSLLGLHATPRALPRGLGMFLGATCDLVSALTGRRLPLSRQRVRAMITDVRYSGDLLRKDLGGYAEYGIDVGLARTLSWFQSVGKL